MRHAAWIVTGVLVTVTGCGPASMQESPVLWHEGEAYVEGPANEQEGVGEKPPASGGQALYGLSMNSAGDRVHYRVRVPSRIPDARILIRYSRFHWFDMPPSRASVELAREGRRMMRTITFPDTGGWGTTDKAQWALASANLGTLPAGRWDVAFTMLKEKHGDVNIDGFFLAPASVSIRAEEFAVADRIEISSDRYVGVAVKGTTVRQEDFEGLDLVYRGFVPASAGVKVTLHDREGESLALLYENSSMPLADEPRRVHIPAEIVRELHDGTYEIHAQWESGRTFEVPIHLVGRLCAGFEERFDRTRACHRQLQQREGELSRHKPSFAHAVEYLEAGWKKLRDGTAGQALIANLRRALEQYDEAARRIAAGRPPFEELRGDLRLAFRSEATGKLEPYRLFIPKDYREGGESPCVLVLNHTEDRFLDYNEGETKRVAEEYGYVMISPRASSGYWGPGKEDLYQLVQQVLADYPGIDPERLYGTGTSRGGFGTYSLATAYPDLFAAIACHSGVGNWIMDEDGSFRDEEGHIRLKEDVANVPTLILHGEIDNLVRVELARDVSRMLKERGIPHELHVFESTGHGYGGNAERYFRMTLEFFDKYGG